MTNIGLHISGISKHSLIKGGCPSWCGKLSGIPGDTEGSPIKYCNL